jgi:orotate phosphoribosyltransferase
MVSIFNYGFELAKTAFDQAGVPLRSLTNYETLIQMALEKKIVSEEQKVVLLNWQKDPANWKAVY